jgi:hypothetical protein
MATTDWKEKAILVVAAAAASVTSCSSSSSHNPPGQKQPGQSYCCARQARLPAAALPVLPAPPPVCRPGQFPACACPACSCAQRLAGHGLLELLVLRPASRCMSDSLSSCSVRECTAHWMQYKTR